MWQKKKMSSENETQMSEKAGKYSFKTQNIGAIFQINFFTFSRSGTGVLHGGTKFGDCFLPRNEYQGQFQKTDHGYIVFAERFTINNIIFWVRHVDFEAFLVQSSG